MSVAVFDAFVTRPDGRVMHFDILVPEEKRDFGEVLRFGRRYLAAKGVPSQHLKSTECNFCHLEIASTSVRQAIEKDGFAIVELQNCEPL